MVTGTAGQNVRIGHVPTAEEPTVTATHSPNGASSRDATATRGADADRHAEDPSIGQLIAEASQSLSTLVHNEIELAKLELKSSVRHAGAGAGLFAAAGVVLAFSLTFGFLALAEGLVAAGLWRWVAYLVVFGMQLAVVGGCVYLGVKKVKRIRAPERTIETSKETVAYLKAATGSAKRG
jgi:hypothetical protein